MRAGFHAGQTTLSATGMYVAGPEADSPRDTFRMDLILGATQSPFLSIGITLQVPEWTWAIQDSS